MSKKIRKSSCDHNTHIVKVADLPLRCPLPGASLWDAHPAVYLPIEQEPEQQICCPYCNAHYKLVDVK